CSQSLDSNGPTPIPLNQSMVNAMLNVAENSSQYKAFVAETGGGTPQLASGGPAEEIHVDSSCSEQLTAVDFNFGAEGEVLTVAVNPYTMTVVRTLLT
ncbi:MAG: hypothetical protein ACRD6W_08525, partial [Nitrososphaerales archaeon]